MFRQNGRRTQNEPLRGLAFFAVLDGCSFACLKSNEPMRVSRASGAANLQIINVEPDLGAVGRHDKFELTFEVTGTVATHLNWSYGPGPPPGVPAGLGISVEGLFSNDDWDTFVVQPGFTYRDDQRDCIGAGEEDWCQFWDGQKWRSGREWLDPLGDPAWKIRFAPPVTLAVEAPGRAIGMRGEDRP